jgi:hypothetical protein
MSSVLRGRRGLLLRVIGPLTQVPDVSQSSERVSDACGMIKSTITKWRMQGSDEAYPACESVLVDNVVLGKPGCNEFQMLLALVRSGSAGA